MKRLILFFITAACICGCKSDSWLSQFDNMNPGNFQSPYDDGDAPDVDNDIDDYDGNNAIDQDKDVVGDDKNFYYELNDFPNTVSITWNGTDANVENANPDIICYADGGHVTIDLLTNSVSGTEIILQGKTSDGSLKIYSDKKCKLTFNGADITSASSPAINSQGKRIYVHLNEGTENNLCDASTYSADKRYIGEGASEAEEDRKGCFFSEGHLIFSGSGSLAVSGKYKHGIVTDGYFFMRPGVTLIVNEAAKNAIHVKGDEEDGVGIRILGGYIYANTSATAGKAIKCDYDISIEGGALFLNTSGGSEYDSEENDTSSPSDIKTDRNMRISGGRITCKSTGKGGKGFSTDGTLSIDGGEIEITTTGAKYTYSRDLDSSPKGIKADGDLTINDGKINISTTGGEGAEGLESKGTLTINGGEIYIYAYDDAINAAKAINITGGKTYAYASNNDGIDSNGTLTVNGGLVIACGSTAPEEGFDTDRSDYFKINGGTLVGLGGSSISPSSASTQRTVIYGSSFAKGTLVSILDSDSSPLMAFELPRSGSALLFSSPELVSGTYTITTGGSVSDYGYLWNGYYSGGSLSGGSTATTFTASSIVTTIGNSSGGGMPGGGGRPW